MKKLPLFESWGDIVIKDDGKFSVFDAHPCYLGGKKIGSLFTRYRKWPTVEYTELHISVEPDQQQKGIGLDMIKQYVSLYGPIAIVKGDITNPRHMGKLIGKIQLDPWFSVTDNPSHYSIKQA
jgi:hypothetical protein